jgi:hypothetical protein
MKLNLFAYAKPAKDYELNMPDVVDRHRLTLFCHNNDMRANGYVYVAPAVVELEIPYGWDPRAQQIDVLRLQEQEFINSVKKIREQISRLQAIEYTA